jgi:integrase
MRKRRQATFKRLAKEVLELKKYRAKQTYRCARLHLTRLMKFFGPMYLRDITEREWGEYILKCKREKPWRKLCDDKRYMRQVMRLAFFSGMAPRLIELRIPDRQGEAGREITQEEIKNLLAEANPTLGFQIEIALKMGLRLREMLHMRWDQINWTTRTVRFMPQDTKTRKGREIPINPDLHDRFKARWHCSRSPYVFPARFDRDRPQDENKTAWRRCKRKAGVRARWHDLRHTCATRMLRRGVKAEIARVYLGMTEHVLRRIYLHLNQEDLWAAADAMRDVG